MLVIREQVGNGVDCGCHEPFQGFANLGEKCNGSVRFGDGIGWSVGFEEGDNGVVNLPGTGEV